MIHALYNLNHLVLRADCEAWDQAAQNRDGQAAGQHVHQGSPKDHFQVSLKEVDVLVGR